MKEINDGFKDLMEIVGAKLAMKIVEVFAGSVIYVPKNILTTKKHLEVVEGYNSGKSYRELSLLSGYSESYIRDILSRKRTVNQKRMKQLSLFQFDFDTEQNREM